MIALQHGLVRFVVLASTLLQLPGSVQPGEESALPWVEGSTTLAVLPDTERYSDDYPELFEAQTQWIQERHEERSIAFAIHLGDITQHNAPPEWAVARRCFGMLDGHVPYALAPGNHDYSGPERGTRLNEHFKVAEVEAWPTFGGVFEAGRLENSYHLLRIGGRDWIVLALEFGPRDEVVAWADKVLDRYSDRLGILVTHAYLFRGNVRYDHLQGSQRASPHEWGNDGEQLWQKLVRRHANVMIVLSGHVSTGGVGYLASEGDYGNTVHQVMADYEKGRRGGSAYLRLLEFLPDGKAVQVKTYSPALDRYATDPQNQFTFKLELADRKTPKPVSATPSSRLSKAPLHRYSFKGTGGDGARISDSTGKAHGVLEAEETDSCLDGKGQVVLVGNGRVALPSDMLASLEDVSFEVWFTPTAEEYKWHSAVRFGGGRDWLGYIFRTRTVHRAEIAVARHNEDIQRKVPVEPGQTLHVVVTYDHDGADGQPVLSYYRDGKPYGTMPTSLRLTDVKEPQAGLGPFEGKFEELRIYDYPLRPAEVQGSYLAGPNTLSTTKGR